MIEVPNCNERVTRLDDARYHGPRRHRDSIDLLVGHATGSAHEFASSQEWMNRDIDPLGKKGPTGKLSYHYGIDRDGSITRALTVDYIAYSNGDSGWPAVHYPPGNKSSVNPRAVGIAWANDNKGEELTAEQLESGLWLFTFWMQELELKPSRCVGHYEISPGRKSDTRPSLSMREFRSMLAEVVVR